MKTRFLLSLLLGINASQLFAEVEPSIIQPRTVGSIWNYPSFEVNDEGALQPSGTSQELVVGSTEMEGKTIYRIRTRTKSHNGLGGALVAAVGGPADSSDSYFWEFMDEKGSYHFTEDDEEPSPPSSLAEFSLALPYPTQEGATSTFDTEEWVVLDTAREITVPAGTFTTVVYQSTDLESESRDTYYQAPGVGIVRWQLDELLAGAWTPVEEEHLVSFEINVAP